jgi:hypothetical protein
LAPATTGKGDTSNREHPVNRNLEDTGGGSPEAQIHWLEWVGGMEIFRMGRPEVTDFSRCAGSPFQNTGNQNFYPPQSI